MSVPTVAFQLVSDLHMEQGGAFAEYRSRALDNHKCEYLLLAGDIGSVGRSDHHSPFSKWLLRQCRKHKLVFWVAGNHEFRGSSVEYGLRIMREIAADPNMMGRLIVLEKDRFDLLKFGVNISILGCTLWTRIRWDQNAGDGSTIMGNSKVQHNQRFEESFTWLKREVQAIRKEDPKRRILVITHHAPALINSSRPEFEEGEDTSWSGFKNDILGGEGVPGLQAGDVWAFGHTHWGCDFYQDDVRCIQNAMVGRKICPT